MKHIEVFNSILKHLNMEQINSVECIGTNSKLIKLNTILYKVLVYYNKQKGYRDEYITPMLSRIPDTLVKPLVVSHVLYLITKKDKYKKYLVKAQKEFKKKR